MKIQLLGSPTIQISNGLTPTFKTAKAEGLFYYLAATQKTHSRPTLATLFWGDMAESKARVNLSKALSELREQVGDYVTIVAQTVVFNRTLPYQLDVESFLAAKAKPKADESIEELRVRADYYQGDFLHGFYVRNAPDFERWQLAERERLRGVATQLFSTLATRYQQGGDLTNATGSLRRLLALEPWREEAHYQVMHLLVQTGETQAALRQYELCRAALAEELDVEPGAAIKRLYAELRANSKAAGVRERPAALPAVYTPPLVVREQARPPHNLPHPPTAFVGRTAEIKALAARLHAPDCRLLTLVGPGGIGKTRLALEVAQIFVEPAASALFPEGIFFVNLMPVDSAAGMISAMAESLDFTFYNNTPPKQQLLNYLKSRKLLLILDNFEHLTGESALLADLLAAAPGVKLLVTARTTLPLQSAYLHAVQGLAYPLEQKTATDGVAAAATDAVRLFVQSAQRQQSAFTLPPNLISVVAICHLTGGLPLALELAAAWLKSLSCIQIAQELAKGVALLRANLLDIPERHRDMRMVFEQTWQRLTPTEAAVMQWLALFRGGFTLAAAEAVAGSSIQTLASLSEKALLRLDEGGRYQIHELLRQFAVEKLSVGKVQAEMVAATHARYFLDLAAQLKTHLTDHRQQAALATLQADVDNLRTAWFWALQQPDLSGIEETMDSLYLFYLFTCRYNEGKDLFATSAALLDTLSAVENLISRMATRAAVFAYHLGEYEQPDQHFTSLLSINPDDHCQSDIAIAHSILGQIAGWRVNHAEAVEHLQKSMTLFQRLGDHSNVALVLYRIAEMYEHTWNYQQAREYAQACLAIGVQLGRNDLIASAHLTLGSAYKGLGQPKVALEHFRQGCVYSEKTQDRLAYGLAMGGIGAQTCHLYPKQWVQGFALLQQSLTICRELGHFVHVITRFILLGLACLDGKRYAEAMPFAEECVQIGTATNYHRAVDFGLRILATSCYEMGDFATGRLHLQQAARQAIERNYQGLTHNFIIYGLLLEKEATQLTAKAANQNCMDAVTLTTVALRYPVWHEYYQKGENLLVRQKAHLSAEQFATAQVRADQHTLEALARQILRLEPVQNDSRCQ